MEQNPYSMPPYVNLSSLLNPKLKVPIAQQYQSPDGSYLPDVNVVLQHTGGVLTLDSGPEVFRGCYCPLEFF